MKYAVILEHGKNNYSAYAPDLPGCVATGVTEEKALSLMREAIALHLEDLKATGQPVPQSSSLLREVEVCV
ncbi:MAG: type II toxin-antitoxin system HicB family antitoxin [bacterium]